MSPIAAGLVLVSVAAQAEAPAVLLVAWNGRASPVACVSKGVLKPGMQCKGLLRSRETLRSAEGAVLKTGEWNPKSALCPWSAGSQDDRKLQLGTLALCDGDAECADGTPPVLAAPARSNLKLWPRRALDATRFPSGKELEGLVALTGQPPATVEPGEGFEVDLDGDGKPDRLVQLRLKRTEKMRRTTEPARFTFLLVDGAAPKQLAPAGCTQPSFLGASDLDGDGKPELVFLFQYQVILFRGDGKVLVQNAECCGEG